MGSRRVVESPWFESQSGGSVKVFARFDRGKLDVIASGFNVKEPVTDPVERTVKKKNAEKRTFFFLCL